MANIRFVKAPNDNRVRPIADVSVSDLNYNSPVTDNSASAPARRSDNIMPKTKPDNDIRNTVPNNLFLACNNNASTSSPQPRVPTGNSKKGDRINNYTENTCEMPRGQSFKEGLPTSAVEGNDNEGGKYIKMSDTLKSGPNKCEQNVISRTSRDGSNKSAKIKLEHTKRKRDEDELNATQIRGAKETEDLTTKSERRTQDYVPDSCRSGTFISQSGTQQFQQQEQQKQKRQEAKQSTTSHQSHSQQVANRQNNGSTDHQFKPHANSRTLYRSISDAEMIDEPSFFGSISDVKYYGLDDDDDDDDTEAVNISGNSKEKKVISETAGDYRPNSKRPEETITVRHDVMSTSGLGSNSKSKSGSKTENESKFNVEKSETMKQNKLHSQEEKKTSMTQEKKTLEGNTGSTLTVMKSKISEAMKTGFKMLDNLEEKNCTVSKDRKVNTVEEKKDKSDEVKNNTLSVSPSKISQERNLGVAQSKILEEQNVDITQRKILEDKKASVTKTGAVDEKKRNAPGEKKTYILEGNKSVNENSMLDGIKSKLSEEKKPSMTKRSTIEENMSNTLEEKNEYVLADNKISMFEDHRSKAQSVAHANISVEAKIPVTQSKISAEKTIAAAQNKISEEKKAGVTQTKTSEEKRLDKTQSKISQEQALGSRQNKPSEEKKLGVTHSRTTDETKLDKMQSKAPEEKKLVVTEGKILKEKELMMMQTKISEEKIFGVTQGKMSEEKKFGVTQGTMSDDKKSVVTQSKIEDKKMGVSQGKLSEEKKLSATQNEISEQKKSGATQSKISEEKKLSASQNEISEQKKLGVTQGKELEEKRVGVTLDTIPEEKKLSVMQGKIAEESASGNISGSKQFITQEKMSVNKKLTMTHCELLQDTKCTTSKENSEDTFSEKKISSFDENKYITLNAKCKQVRDDDKNVAVAQGKMPEDKKLRETKTKTLGDKKTDVTPGKVFEDKRLLVAQREFSDEKKLIVMHASKSEERKCKRFEDKTGEPKDSTLDARKNKLAGEVACDATEGTKLKTFKKNGRAKSEEGKNNLLNEKTMKILEDRKSQMIKKKLDEQNAKAQKGITHMEDKHDIAPQKSNLTLEPDTAISNALLDAMTPAERLKLRRSALANPEKMIMSQDQREQIEKEVEKNKTSVARKVSQFLNVQLGFNKEENLN